MNDVFIDFACLTVMSMPMVYNIVFGISNKFTFVIKCIFAAMALFAFISTLSRAIKELKDPTVETKPDFE